ncbi:electron transport complex subunit C [Clostridium polyendosporum]|uniref:Ion-translocating oxidoreductase complex subunit C n=1 Tax=Clostridium polyendosporum TaxID=69208 RepID=A0A919S0R0_9CLOT|nr:electron transport complex subunit RsxC [Clostridium polyendosporum]GIM29692.1 electron transport complex subunit C [Clostridium polyendosporum]
MIKGFRGGIHPNDHKSNTADKPIEAALLPRKVIIPVRQHIGAPCSPVVKKGDRVKKGQVIASSESFISSPVHASISGIVVDIDDYSHAIFGKCLSIVIDNDGLDEWTEEIPVERDWEKLSVNELREIIRQAGIVGMGGATFPTHVKLSPPKDKNVDVFILNAAECEPYLTADHRMMLEYTDYIVTGVQIAMKVLGVNKGYVGIEDNKSDAIKVMKRAFVETQIDVVPLPTRYPQGGEKMLIKMITNREVSSGCLPTDVGVVVQNVGTVIAISNAVSKGIPVIERVITVTGGAVREPKNLLIRIGTTFAEVIENCGGFKKVPRKVIMGGPMMGFAQSTLDVPVMKGVSGILALSKEEVNYIKQSPCIRCGHCIEVCPMGLNPSMLSVLGEHQLYKEAKEDYNLLDCIECGCCVYVCPAKRNIVQYIRYCKAQNVVNKG